VSALFCAGLSCAAALLTMKVKDKHMMVVIVFIAEVPVSLTINGFEYQSISLSMNIVACWNTHTMGVYHEFDNL
jgi:hypothetical protein